MEHLYAAKCIFKHNDLDTEEENAVVYEERIILVKADNEDSAVSQAEKEAREYAKGLGDTEYVDYTMVFHIFDENIILITELFSEMRESAMSPDEYIDHFYDTGKERARNK
ncbi:MAG: DUF4288 domain-containing protein [Planctomycetota bacterium]